tara:strand:+ start:3173 stop:4306 length:1134 start_codon:yes stop_codon:yes gene_type:complete
MSGRHSHISPEFHAIMTDEITKVCDRSLRRWGPHQLCNESPQTGYVHPLMFLDMLARTITCRIPFIYECEIYCGPSWERREIGEPFNDNINAFPDRIQSMMKSWVENVSSIAYDLYQRDIQDYVPWCEINKILHFYLSEARLQISRYQNEDPENLKEFQDRYQRELYGNAALGHTLEGWRNVAPVQPSVIKERCEWQIKKLNDLFRDLCVPEIDERYPEGLLSVSHTREDIAQWWAVTIQQGCRPSWVSCRPGAEVREDLDVLRVLASVGWTPQQDRDIDALLQRADQESANEELRLARFAEALRRGAAELAQEVETPEPPDTPSIERPRVNEPVHPVKRKLTELLYFIEDKRESWNMNEGDYLVLTKKLKETFDSV